jgi:DNA invertase Pin-like site-specific DNA recombinase
MTTACGGVPREGRPAMKALLRAVARREMTWWPLGRVDRLGRSQIDLLAFLGELHAKKIDLYLHQKGLDTSTPAGWGCFRCSACSPSSSAALSANG